MKKIEDYLHLYLGCEASFFNEGLGSPPIVGKLISIELDRKILSLDTRYRIEFHYLQTYFKLNLRPLSDMTEEEAVDIYTLERDRVLHVATNDHDISKRTDFGWVITRLDHMNIGLLVRFDGVCYKVIDEGKKPTIEPAMNQPIIFQYMLSKGFDLFGLIEAGLAIDKTKINQP